jgi:hypothetical protein
MRALASIPVQVSDEVRIRQTAADEEAVGIQETLGHELLLPR